MSAYNLWHMTVDEKKLHQIIGDELDDKLAVFFGKFSRHFDKRFDQLESSKADRSQVEKLQNSVDGIVKRKDNDDTERATINYQLDRHQNRIDELADNTKTKLSTP